MEDVIISDKSEPCFYCKKLTNRIDINFHGYYCGEDDDAIGAELAALPTVDFTYDPFGEDNAKNSW